MDSLVAFDPIHFRVGAYHGSVGETGLHGSPLVLSLIAREPITGPFGVIHLGTWNLHQAGTSPALFTTPNAGHTETAPDFSWSRRPAVGVSRNNTVKP